MATSAFASRVARAPGIGQLPGGMEVSGENQPAGTGSTRLLSLDAYRGFIMLLLVSGGFGFGALRQIDGWEWLAGQVDHARWNGCTFWDLIQPAFTFMVGMAMPFSLAKRVSSGDSQLRVYGHVAWRALMLIVLSNVYSNWGEEPGRLRIQFINVLCQIAFGYLLCALILRLRFVHQTVVAVAMLAGYWAIFVLFPGPDGPWSQDGNIGAVIDMAFLGYNYSGHYTTINFVGNAVTILFGCWAGMLVRSGRTHASVLRILGSCAAAGLALGLTLEPLNPMVKRLWTASFTLYSAGWVILMLIAFYWVIEVRQLKRWTLPFLVLGMNSLFVYSLWQVGISGWMDRGIAGFTARFASLGPWGAIPQHLLVLAGLWYLCYWLYQRRIFFKL